MTSRIAAIAIDAVDQERMVGFWTAVLGWRIVGSDDEVITIGPPDDTGPTIDVTRAGEPKTATKNRLHLDLRANGSSQEREVERVLALGARHADVGQGPDVSWVVLADPEGNEFCILK